MSVKHSGLLRWVCLFHPISTLQGSELSSWTTGHFTNEGFDIFQNFPDLNSILWDAEDKGMVPKLTPNHHVPIPEHFEANSSVKKQTNKYAYRYSYIKSLRITRLW